MKITTKGRFAVTAMLDIALEAEGVSVPLAMISERQNISVAYLEQLFCKLRRAGLVVSARGPGGGYRLAKHLHEITMDQIVEAVDEDIDSSQCKGEGTCSGGASCLSHHLWQALNLNMKKFLSAITLETMVRQHHNQQGTIAPPKSLKKLS